MKRVLVEPVRLWSYINSKTGMDSPLYTVAENDDYGSVIYVTKTDGECYIVVYIDDVEVFHERIANQYDAERSANRVFDTYLTDSVVAFVSDDGSYDEEKMIDEREEELSNAFIDLMDVVLEYDSADDVDGIAEDVKELVLEYLYKKKDISVYRPMYLEDEAGELFFEEYPYEHMVLDEEGVAMLA